MQMFFDFGETVTVIFLTITLIGQTIIYSFEIMQIVVQGFKEYFSDGWNFMDQLTYFNYLIYYVVKVFFKNEQGTLDKSKL